MIMYFKHDERPSNGMMKQISLACVGFEHFSASLKMIHLKSLQRADDRIRTSFPSQLFISVFSPRNEREREFITPLRGIVYLHRN